MNSLMEMLNKRTSIRKYKDKPVSEELLNSILTSAARTQTMGNLQLYSVVVTRDEEMKKSLAPAHFNQPMVCNAPVVLTICADFNRTTKWCENRNATPGYNNLLSFINAASDALLYAQTVSCLAEEAGLGVCYLGTTVYMSKAIVDTLKLPRLVMPIATLTIGWPNEQPQLTDRLAPPAFVHSETYEDYTAESIDMHYAAKEALPENRHFVEINNKETLAQIFTDIRYTKAANEEMSRTFLETLCTQGFISSEQLKAYLANSEVLKDDGFQPFEDTMVESRPDVLECDVVRFQNNKEKWVAFVGLLHGRPYEIFTGLMDDEEGILLPKSVTKGRIIKAINPDGTKRYDFQFENKRGYKTTVEGLSGKFNKEYWNYAKLISGVLRYRMPLERVIHLVSSLSLDAESINTWKIGVERALKKYVGEEQPEEN